MHDSDSPEATRIDVGSLLSLGSGYVDAGGSW